MLPFANLTGDPEQEYLSDGLTQEMIAQLGRLHPETLSVIARTSVMRYKKTDKPIDQIGRELGRGLHPGGQRAARGGPDPDHGRTDQGGGPDAALGGPLRARAGGHPGAAERGGAEGGRALALKLLPAEQARLANARAVNPEAYDAYLKGPLLYKLTPADLDTAQQYFELALQRTRTTRPLHAESRWCGAAASRWGWRPAGSRPEGEGGGAEGRWSSMTPWRKRHFALAGILDLDRLELTRRPTGMEARPRQLNPNYPEARRGIALPDDRRPPGRGDGRDSSAP